MPLVFPIKVIEDILLQSVGYFGVAKVHPWLNPWGQDNHGAVLEHPHELGLLKEMRLLSQGVDRIIRDKIPVIIRFPATKRGGTRSYNSASNPVHFGTGFNIPVGNLYSPVPVSEFARGRFAGHQTWLEVAQHTRFLIVMPNKLQQDITFPPAPPTTT